MATLIPLGDASRQPRRFAVVTLLIILTNAYVFLQELVKGDAFVARWALIPASIVHGRNLVTLVTGTFLHAGWLHIAGNMVFLWAFGPEMEDAMNPARYLVFYLLGGVVSMAAQIGIDPASTLPNLGASGAIAAVMGAFLVTYPRDKIRTILIIGIFVRITFIPAALLIGFWFLTQLVSFGVIAGAEGGGVAYMAHISGVIFGAAASRLFEDPRRLASQRDKGWSG